MRKKKIARGVQLGFGVNAYVSLGMAGFFALLPVTSGVAPVAGALGTHYPGADWSTLWSMLTGVIVIPLTIFSILIAPWLIPCLVLRARQPKGAYIDWDEREIAEWNGPWKRAAISWRNAEGAHIEWHADGRYGGRTRRAIQVLDKTNPRAVITAWEEEPEETPIVRRRLETSRSGINYLDSAVLSHCGYSRSFEMERIVDPDRPVQRSLVRYFTRLGYVGAFIGPLFGGENPVAGFAISGVAALLLAWRALPVLRELARVGSKLRARPAEEIEAWRYRFRAALAEACVRVVFVILPIVGSIASAMIEPQ